MADHIRKQIRGAVVTLLTGLTTTGARVYKSRTYQLDPDLELPALLVYTPNEDTDDAEVSGFCTPGTMERQITVAVEAVATANSNCDDTLDLICKEVEAKVATSPLLGITKLNSFKLKKTETQFSGGDTEKPVGSARMTWLAKVQTIEGAPDVPV